MKKLTASIFATLLAVVSVDAAQASIASKGYVDDQVGTVSATVATKADQSTVDTLSDKVTANESAIANKADKSTTLAGYGITDAYTKGEVDSALSGKQATLTTEQQNAVNSGITTEKVATYDGYAAQIAAKADTSALANYVTTENANANYAAKSTEGVANTASTNAQQALTNIGTLTNLTTDAKTNTVAAINEVATEAAAAQSAAGTAQAAAEAAQGGVDALEVRVGTAESDIDNIQEQIGNMATSEVVEGLKTDVEGLKTNKLDKSVYDSQVGTVSAGNMGTTATTVVTAIKEVATEAATAQSTATAAQSAASEAQTDATQALEDAAAAQETANAAIPKPTGTCSNPTAKCVLTYNNSQYTWEVIERGEDGE